MREFCDALKKYACFDGRASLREYWMFMLMNAVFLLVATCLDAVVAGALFLYMVAVFLPGLAVCVRRLHDVGQSGWLVLVVLVPLAGALVLLYYLVQPSSGDKNRN